MICDEMCSPWPDARRDCVFVSQLNADEKDWFQKARNISFAGHRKRHLEGSGRLEWPEKGVHAASSPSRIMATARSSRITRQGLLASLRR